MNIRYDQENTLSTQACEKTKTIKWCVSKVVQYIMIIDIINQDSVVSE